MAKKTDYSRALEAAREEMARLLKKQATIDSRVIKLRKSIHALSQLVENTPEYDARREPAGGTLRPSAESGITDAICELLRNHGPLSTVELRDRLNEQGLNINAYASGLSMIHNTLRRLQQQEEINVEKGPNGTMAYPLQKGKRFRNQTQLAQVASP
jgi:hypothetical protein